LEGGGVGYGGMGLLLYKGIGMAFLKLEELGVGRIEDTKPGKTRNHD
jgi:hypothetical protein